MKIKTINKIIGEKVDDWVSSIGDKQLGRDVKDKVIVTGGCIVSMLQGEDVNDFDIYFQDREITFRIAKYYVGIAEEKYHKGIAVENEDRVRIVIPNSGVLGEQNQQTDEIDQSDIDAVEEDKSIKDYSPIHLSENAITLKGKVQLITRFYGSPGEIHVNYDFIHCTNYWTKKTSLVTNTEALESILTKELRYVGSLYPLCSIIRTRKFIGRGWRIHAGEYLKMCFQLTLMDLTDVNVLRDQLTGVDSAYFHAIIAAIVWKQEEDDSFELKSEYLNELINRVFG